MKRKSKSMLVIALLFFPILIFGNNIQVSNIILRGRNISAGVNSAENFSLVQFDLSWSNTWRVGAGPANWDAAWVFIKFQLGTTNPSFTGVNSSGTTVTLPAGSNTSSLRVGMPVRVSSGTGAFAANSIISSITNSSQFVVSALPSTTLSNATIQCLLIWEHALLNNNGHTAPAGSTIDAGLLSPTSVFNASTNPALGIFIYKDSESDDNITNSFTGIRLRWNYGRNQIPDSAWVTVQVFAIEMVYVPGGVAFAVGGTGGTSPFTQTTINTSNATTTGGYPSNRTAPASASWPNGYNAFYCMKYEISQGQYRDFLNTLTYFQQATRTQELPTSTAGTGALSFSNTNRNGIDIQSPGNATTVAPAVYGCNLDNDATYNEATDGEWIACNFLSWMDGCAYMDWAGLRPMTEMEFEKACRGNQAVVPNEFAWGNTTRTGATGISSSGTSAEVFSNAGANCVFGNNANVQGPLRVGAFAGAATTRTQAGASYYGIMEMSGNVFEATVSIGSVAGGSFLGIHGNGTLFRDGSADTDFWPGINGNSSTLDANTIFNNSTGVTQAAGSIYRGGAFNTSSTNSGPLNVTDRSRGENTPITRSSEMGFRGVRSF